MTMGGQRACRGRGGCYGGELPLLLKDTARHRGPNYWASQMGLSKMNCTDNKGPKIFNEISLASKQQALSLYLSTPIKTLLRRLVMRWSDCI